MIKKEHAPIALFAFNRVDHLKNTVNSLLENSEAKDSIIYFFCDGPREGNSYDRQETKLVREYLKTVTGFQKVNLIEREKNLGLANSIINGVTDVVSKHGKIIVLEDDMVCSPYFLQYMNKSLEFYKDTEKVASIHAYSYPCETPLPETFFLRGADCWGWATWERAWQNFEADGKILLEKIKDNKLESEFNFNDSADYLKMLENQIAGSNNSWAIRWYASAFLKNMLTLYPGISMVQNIGCDDTGTHCDDTDEYKVILADRELDIDTEVKHSEEAFRAFEDFFLSQRNSTVVSNTPPSFSIISKIKNRFSGFLKR